MVFPEVDLLGTDLRGSKLAGKERVAGTGDFRSRPMPMMGGPGPRPHAPGGPGGQWHGPLNLLLHTQSFLRCRAEARATDVPSRCRRATRENGAPRQRCSCEDLRPFDPGHRVTQTGHLVA